MKIQLLRLKPGDRFRLGNIEHVRLEAGEANAADIRLHTLVKLPYTQEVDIPPYDPVEEAITEEEIAQMKEDEARGISMMDKIMADVHPLDEE